MGQSTPINVSGFINAQQMALVYPDTFDAPYLLELNSLKLGDTVKVCHQLSHDKSERFWCIIRQIKDDIISAEVNNHLFHNHGFSDGDIIDFNKNDIYQIYREEGHNHVS